MQKRVSQAPRPCALLQEPRWVPKWYDTLAASLKQDPRPARAVRKLMRLVSGSYLQLKEVPELGAQNLVWRTKPQGLLQPQDMVPTHLITYAFVFL